MKFVRWVIKRPILCAIGLLVAYFIAIHLIPIWNEEVVPKCILALSFRDTGITDIFIPVFLVLIAYAFFDRYKLYEELETSCHLVKAEFEANEHLMLFFEKYVIDASDEESALTEFNNNATFCNFRHFHLDRFKLGMTHIKPNSADEQRLNKWRSKTLQTINLLNNWLAAHRTTATSGEGEELTSIKEFLINKFKRLREERAGTMDIMNQLLKSNKLEEIELTIKSVSRR